MRRFARPTFAFALCLSLASCREWAVARGPLPQATADALGHGRRGTIRVELNSGSVVAITGAAVRNDSVFGMVPAADRNQASSSVGYALSEIRRVEYQRVNVSSPLGFAIRLALLGLVVFVGIFIVAFSQIDD